MSNDGSNYKRLCEFCLCTPKSRILIQIKILARLKLGYLTKSEEKKMPAKASRH